MSEDRSRCRIHSQQPDHLRMAFPKNQMYDHNRDHTFKTVSKQCDCSCLCAQCTQCIGRSGISASVITDIDTVYFSIQIRGLEKSTDISDQNTENPFHKYPSPDLIILIFHHFFPE